MPSTTAESKRRATVQAKPIQMERSVAPLRRATGSPDHGKGTGMDRNSIKSPVP